jgi:hypothetical protein
MRRTRRVKKENEYVTLSLYAFEYNPHAVRWNYPNKIPSYQRKNWEEFISVLNSIRAYLKRDFVIVAGYVSDELNLLADGAYNSFHSGKNKMTAVDITTSHGVDEVRRIYDVIVEGMKEGAFSLYSVELTHSGRRINIAWCATKSKNNNIIK